MESGQDVAEASIALAWQLVQQHGAGHQCPQCRQYGCDRLVWAHDELERLDEDRDWYGERLLAIRANIRDAEAGRPLYIRPAAVGWARGRASPAG
jgi:hypothetical protein